MSSIGQAMDTFLFFGLGLGIGLVLMFVFGLMINFYFTILIFSLAILPCIIGWILVRFCNWRKKRKMTK